jgi:hypothetical protein
MNRAPRAASPRYSLWQDPGGSFTARARGLLTPEFVLLNLIGEELGRLRLCGASGAEFRSGDLVTALEASGSGYRMVADGEELLVATPKGWFVTELEVSSGGQSYEARIDLLRNLAVASYRKGGETAVRLSGGLLGRRYKALLATGDRCAFPIAVFLLWHVAANRRHAYRKGRLAGRAAM